MPRSQRCSTSKIQIRSLSSTYKAVSVDKPSFFRNSSTYKPLFVEELGFLPLVIPESCPSEVVYVFGNGFLGRELPYPGHP